MACEKRPYLCAILVLCSIALFFHVVGFVTPGWLIMRRSVGGDSFIPMKDQVIDNGGLTVPPEAQDDDPKPMFRKRRSDYDDRSSEDSDRGHHSGHGGHHGPHHGDRPHHPPHHGRPGPHHGDGPHPPPTRRTRPIGMTGPTTESAFLKKMEDDEDMNEKQNVQSWLSKTMSEIETFDVRTSYGLWYSTVCVHEKKMGDHDSEEKHMDMDRSSSEDDDDDMEGHHYCKKMSTKCALSYSFIYENYMSFTHNGGYLSYRNFGYASLTEHRVESCLVLTFMVFGLISAIVGFRKVNGCRCAGVACVIFMSLAAFIALVPVARLCHYSMSRAHHESLVKVQAPYSVIATFLGAVFALISALVAGCALVKSRKERHGKWLQFNNEIEMPNENKEKPGVYFTAEALPAKPGLYDVCDFADIKPVEEVRKQPEAVEEPDEFVL